MKKNYALALILLMGCGGESDPDPVEEKLNYTITVSAGEGGSVDTLGGTYPEGTALTITATPDAEYLFDGWSGTEISTSNPLNIILTGNESVVANFVKKQYDLALSIEGEGTVEEVVTQAGKEYASGTEVELTAIPAEGWMFNGWTGDLETIDNPASITIDKAKSVTATFIRKTYELTVNIEGEGTVDEQVVVAPSQYEFETQVELTANPAEGWEFSNWSGAVEGTDNPVTIEITDAKEVTAVFTRKIYDLNVTIQGEGTVAEEVVVAPSQYEFETQVKLTANPAEGWEFANWSGAVEGSDNPVTIEITDAQEVTAVFTRKIYDLNVTIQGEGTVDEEVVVAPSQYEFETQVELTANPAEFYKFVAWSGYLETTDNPITVLIDQGISLTATFELKDTDGDGVTDDIDQCPNTPEGAVIDENGCQIPPIYLAENGVTVKARDFAQVGETWELNGAEYTVVDETTLRQMVDNDEDVERVVTSKVTAMNELFYKKSGFNADLSSWDVSSVINMASMFNEASLFNSDLSLWDVSAVNNISGMFYAAGSFNSDLSDWDVSSVNNMAFTFDGASSFNSDLSAWNVSNVASMNYMFHRASSFNADLSSWDVSSVNNMESMFNKANSFNANLSTWDVSSVNNMVSMFNEANSFNQDLSSWNVASVNNMSGMFYAASSFKSDLSSWDVSSVNNMTFMFDGASSFDSDISAWNVSNVTSMNYMFHRASSFNQDLSKWCVPLIQNEPSNFAVNATAWVLSKPRWGTCPLEDDTDSDGVVDYYDLCPNTPAGAVIDENGCQIPPIYVTENGVTIKARDFAQVGDTWEINGAEYTVVDETTLRQMVNNDEDVTRVVTTKIINMASLFFNKNTFNQNIASWDTSNVEYMNSMFAEATNFNQDISEFNTSKVTTMNNMFREAKKFNQNIEKWDTSNVTEFNSMFYQALAFNQSIGNWNTSKVTTFNRMFFFAENFESDLNSWDVSNGIDMSHMFFGTKYFNSNLTNWNVSNVTDMSSMFAQAISFNQNINSWDTSNVNNMNNMFREALSFNQDISSWNTSNVIEMNDMFYQANAFNQPLNSWDVSNVKVFDRMFFNADIFNQDLSSWNVKESISMISMFSEAREFNQDLSTWCVPNITNEPDRFSFDTQMSTEDLPRWGTCPLEDDTDSDGVVDYYDLCPDTPAGTIVNQNGCDSGFYIDPNNVTIRCENANIGDVATVNGKTYKVTSDQNLISDRDAYLLDGNPNTCLCTSKLTSLYGSEKIGRDIVDFNIEDVTDWDVSNVGSMYGTFWGTKTNPNLKYWDVGKVTNMSYLFWEATYFNSDISNWDVKSVTGMEGMFGKASFFNQDISNWNTSNVRQMRFMFESASNFNQNIGNWDVSSVLRFNRMFRGNTTFNQDLSNWDVSNASEMDSMFNSATSFNQDLSNWNVDNITLCSGFSVGASSWTLPKPNFTNCNPN